MSMQSGKYDFSRLISEVTSTKNNLEMICDNPGPCESSLHGKLAQLNFIDWKGPRRGPTPRSCLDDEDDDNDLEAFEQDSSKSGLFSSSVYFSFVICVLYPLFVDQKRRSKMTWKLRSKQRLRFWDGAAVKESQQCQGMKDSISFRNF